MRRREFIAALGGAAVMPFAAHAQQMMPVIGYIDSASRESRRFTLTGFQQGLKEIGYADGQNLAIEYRWGNGQYDRLPALAADLVGRGVAAIVTGGGTVTALAAKAATTTIPIVFIVGGDPVEAGLIASLNRPGGNATGVSILTVALAAKRLELLRELVPSADVIRFLVNPASPNAEVERTRCWRPPLRWAYVSRSCTRPPSTTSTRFLQRWSDRALLPFSSAPIRSSPANAITSSRWRRVTPYPRCTQGANIPPQAGS